MKRHELVQRVSWQLARDSIENSTRLLAGAKMTVAVDNFGLAVSLSVLSKEEGQKSLLLGCICSGLYSIDDKDVVKELEEHFEHQLQEPPGIWSVDKGVSSRP